MRFSRRTLGSGLSVVAVAAMLAVFPFGTAATAAGPAASAFGASVQLAGEDLVGPTPTVSVPAAPGDATDTVVDVPAEPVLVNGTLTATANAHTAKDIASGLTVVDQAVAGPYNGRGLAQIEGAAVLYEIAGAGIPLLSASVIRSEAAVVCLPAPQYTANSEIIDLAIAGESIPLNAPVQDLIDAISGVLADTGLNAVVDVKRNVVTQIDGGGIGVDALVVTILAAAGDAPLAEIRLAHAEVTAAACGPLPQCSDGADNDTDAKIDAADPGCHTDGNPNNPASYVPTDNDERNAQCSDTTDNDGDAKIDAADPGCHKDGNANNPASYDPGDDDEGNEIVRGAILARTGAESDLALTGAGLALLTALGFRLRRRIVS